MSFTIDLSNPVVYNSLFLMSIPIFAILFFVYYSFIYFIFSIVISFFIKDDYDMKMIGNNMSLAVIIFQILFLAKMIFGWYNSQLPMLKQWAWNGLIVLVCFMKYSIFMYFMKSLTSLSYLFFLE